jgi:hypothetical protein
MKKRIIIGRCMVMRFTRLLRDCFGGKLGEGSWRRGRELSGQKFRRVASRITRDIAVKYGWPEGDSVDGKREIGWCRVCRCRIMDGVENDDDDEMG